MMLEIKLLNGKMWKTNSTVIGDLAIHRSYKGQGLWSVTHVPTTMTLNSVTPPNIRKDKMKLMEWAKRVQEGVKKDWLAMRKITMEELNKDPERTKFLRERIRNYCLQTTAEERE